ncbi:WRKY domain containing protein [Parasponia andersonii]|uniref:WRKY domain containing protein n=1 Tax=Parasponia andersonii TaxID=3476 RepID=A0A2P5DCY9_PARAD|nr:WRKY domain containing protein [Parasponia andersonii]
MLKSKTTNLNHKRKLHPDNMEEHNIVSLILHGCKIVKELESNLESLANQSNVLANYCDEIAKVFGSAKERLRGHDHQGMLDDHDQTRELLQQAQNNIDHASFQEWLIRSSVCSYTQAMDINNTSTHPQALLLGAETRDLSGHIRTTSAHENRNMGRIEFLGSSSPSAPSSSSSQRPRRRKDDHEIRIVNMAAPQIGNTDIPPEDNYTWRKYGQKEIMGSKYPRGYYRCTHQKLYNCPAKKQVQRLDDDPFTFQVMYRGNHTCHMSATAPTSSLPLQAAIMSQEMAAEPLTSSTITSSVAIGRWLSMEFSPAGVGGSSSHGGGAGTSASTKEMVEYPVLDMADAMFNSGSSSSNSMDFLFPSAEGKPRDSGNKKNA